MEETSGSPLFSCKTCSNPLAFPTDLLSKNFLAKSGQAYMFSHVMNVVLGPKEDRQLLTGRFTISTAYCGICKQELGWMYVQAYDIKNRFKEGRFVVEKSKITLDY
ncbi:protein yippee-like At4g27740 [Tripterygium wilfordii]|uniref:protein yippee-like At4g27740 n=1 Tax=Tripterygium wilfordii TaxID=458696 RepID=UPI0018F82426|nr:protein yippee-like At4g27740 [Tripterygium wilfordii]XP_038686255.1 protein yippee-like At4g27740 [Tripterygium wilfordii]